MSVIYDDAHAVNPATVCAVTKADAPQPPPNESAWYLTVQSTGGAQALRWADEGQRDEFYKRLLEAMEKA